MNTPEFIRLKNENRNLRYQYNLLLQKSDDAFIKATKRKKQIKHILKNTYIMKDRNSLLLELEDIWCDFYTISHNMNMIDLQIRNNGIIMLSMKQGNI